ncbi:hypothetical protein TNCV_1754791 [Trichonephila clavipes]|nr:hypothetical protein TNCV_1754791 [Trichonephila clavipes]
MSRQHVAKWCSFQSGRLDVKNRNMAGSGRPFVKDTPPHSPDSAPSDYFLFPRLKEHSSDSAVKASTKIWLRGKGPDSFQNGLNTFVLRTDKCQNRLVDCVEK